MLTRRCGYGYRPYPNVPKEWIWQYVFPRRRLSVDPRSGKTRRHHVHENGLQKAVKQGAVVTGITKRINCHALRFATHLLADGYDIRTVQELPRARGRVNHHHTPVS